MVCKKKYEYMIQAYTLYDTKNKYMRIHRLKCSLIHMTQNIAAGHQPDDQRWAITLFSEKKREIQVSGNTTI
jgi:hypothetical protein